MDVSDPYEYLVWDDTISISYERARSGGGNQPDALAVAVRRPLTNKELAASNGVYTGLDRKFLVPRILFPPDAKPKPADVVIDTADDNSRWTVLQADLMRDWTYHLTCRNPIIAYDLRDLIDIEQAASALDAAGVTVRSWPSTQPSGGTVIYHNLACRVQPMTQEQEDTRAIRGQKVDYEIHLSQSVNIDVRECRVAWNGQILDLVDYRDDKRIDVLPVLAAALRP